MASIEWGSGRQGAHTHTQKKKGHPWIRLGHLHTPGRSGAGEERGGPNAWELNRERTKYNGREDLLQYCGVVLSTVQSLVLARLGLQYQSEDATLWRHLDPAGRGRERMGERRARGKCKTQYLLGWDCYLVARYIHAPARWAVWDAPALPIFRCAIQPLTRFGGMTCILWYASGSDKKDKIIYINHRDEHSYSKYDISPGQP